MKPIIGLFLVFILGCCKSEGHWVSATLEGYDLRLCACCGGCLVKPNDAPDKVFQWYQKGETFDITGLDTFPMKVMINYNLIQQSCIASDGEIEINELVRIK